MNDLVEGQNRARRKLLSQLRERRTMLIDAIAASGLEGQEWTELVAQLKTVHEAMELVKAAQSEDDDYRPSYEGDS